MLVNEITIDRYSAVVMDTVGRRARSCAVELDDSTVLLLGK